MNQMSLFFPPIIFLFSSVLFFGVLHRRPRLLSAWLLAQAAKIICGVSGNKPEAYLSQRNIHAYRFF